MDFPLFFVKMGIVDVLLKVSARDSALKAKKKLKGNKQIMGVGKSITTSK